MLSRYDYFKPESLESALTYLNEKPNTNILAGGTDLLVVLRKNLINCEHMLDIKGISELDKLEYRPGKGLYIGANVIVNDICFNKEIRKKYPALAEGADNLASFQLRNRATVVGNICNASPGADLAPALLVYDAKVVIKSLDSERTISLEDFFVHVKKTVLEPGEIVTAIKIPDVEAGDNSSFQKMARIKGHDLAITGAAVRITPDKKAKIALNAVAITPLRLRNLEEELKDKEFNKETLAWVQEQIPKHIKPISDVRSSKEYRLHVSGVLVRRSMEAALKVEA